MDSGCIMSENWKEKWAAAWPVLLVLPILAFVFSFGVGRFSISPSELLHTLFYHFADPSQIVDSNMETTLFNIRLPRILAVLLVGADYLSLARLIRGCLKIQWYRRIFWGPPLEPDLGLVWLC